MTRTWASFWNRESSAITMAVNPLFRGRQRPVLVRPAKIMRVMASVADYADAHVLQQALGIRRRDFAGIETVHHRVPILVALRLLFENPLTRLRAEIVAPAF